MKKLARQFPYLEWLSLIFGIMLAISAPVEADKQLQAQKEALNVIADFADRICKDIPLVGTGNKIELSGKAKAELNGVITKLANLGIAGTGKFGELIYQGLLQKDLAEVLKASIDCKQDVFRELSKRKLRPRAALGPNDDRATLSDWDRAQAIITYPVDQENINRRINITGTHENVPEGSEMWGCRFFCTKFLYRQDITDNISMRLLQIYFPNQYRLRFG
jgi:hypothetical protein